jgi:hypothetical protein
MRPPARTLAAYPLRAGVDSPHVRQGETTAAALHQASQEIGDDAALPGVAMRDADKALQRSALAVSRHNGAVQQPSPFGTVSQSARSRFNPALFVKCSLRVFGATLARVDRIL